MIFFKQLKKHILRIFVWNIPHHNCGASVAHDAVEIDYVGLRLFRADRATISNCGIFNVVIVAIGHHLKDKGESRR